MLTQHSLPGKTTQVCILLQSSVPASACEGSRGDIAGQNCNADNTIAQLLYAVGSLAYVLQARKYTPAELPLVSLFGYAMSCPPCCNTRQAAVTSLESFSNLDSRLQACILDVDLSSSSHTT